MLCSHRLSGERAYAQVATILGTSKFNRNYLGDFEKANLNSNLKIGMAY